MPTELLTFGQAHTLVTNQVYALPAAKSTLYSDSVGTFEQSNVIDFSTKQTVTLVGGMIELGGAFLRAPTGTPIIRLTKS